MNFHMTDENCAIEIAQYLLDLINGMEKKSIQIACIGTDRSIGDSVGPLIGSMIEESFFCGFDVVGTLENPFHAISIPKRIHEIKKDATIIAIDACVCDDEDYIGTIQINKESISPGAGVDKELPEIGDISIKLIVCKTENFFIRKSIRLNLIYKYSKIITEALELLYDYLNKRNISDIC